MSIKKDPDGRRSVFVEIEVPGTPEEVWQAIASGPGVSSWFVPTEFRDDGTVVSNFGPGMEAVAKITAWEAPQRFVAESPNEKPGGPPIATEWIVEAKGGGQCVVRVVHSLFASTDEWDDQLTSAESGWPWFFAILKLVLAHFRGQPCRAFRVMATTSKSAADAWSALTEPLGLTGLVLGQRGQARPGAPAFGGLVERTGGEGHYGLLLLLDQPTPGLASIFALPMGAIVMVVADFFYYGVNAAAIVAREQPLWQAWLDERFPTVTEEMKC